MDRLGQNTALRFNPLQQFYTSTILMIGIVMLLLIDMIGNRVENEKLNTGGNAIRAAFFPSVANTRRLINDSTGI